LDINMTLRKEDEDGRKRYLPHALTLEPFRVSGKDKPINKDHDFTTAKKLVAATHNIKVPWYQNNSSQKPQLIGVSLIGSANPEEFHHSDSDQIGAQASVEANFARNVGIKAFEVVFNGLQSFIIEQRYSFICKNVGRRNSDTNMVDGYSQDNKDPEIGILLASKLSLSDLRLAKAAKEAYRLGATSIILGDSFVKSRKPTDVVNTVLEQFAKNKA
jgi:hypothetical protein